MNSECSTGLGFVFCVSGNCQDTQICIDLYCATGCALILMSLCLYQIVVRVIEHRKIYKRKQCLFLVILTADTFFLIFTMDRTLVFAYFLYFYFDQCFLIFLVYFFTKKATDLNVYNKNNTKLVRSCTYGLFGFFSILLISDITFYYIKNRSLNCSYTLLFVVRIIELLTCIVFIIGAYYLNKKMNALIVEQIMFTNRMTGGEKTQFIKMRNIKLKFWTLVCVTVFGQFIQWVADLVYFVSFYNEQNKVQVNCLLPAYNNIFPWWGDLITCLLGYFLPLFCAVYLFWFKKKQVQYVESLEVESLPARYYHKLLNKSNSSFSSQIPN